MTAPLLQKKSFRLSGHATSVALEPLFWEQLQCIAEKQGTSVSALVKEEDLKMPGNLASSLRILVVQYLLSTS
jgi:predicted DNA-binding ribbon-helix-helix protein